MKRLVCFFTEITPYVRPENYRTYLAIGISTASGACCHFGFLLAFVAMGARVLAAANVVSVALFLFAVWLNRRGAPQWSAIVAVLEMIGHQALACHFLGWNAGFQYYLPCTMVVVFFLPPGRLPFKVATMGVAVAAYVVLFRLYHGATPAFAVTPALQSLWHDFNAVGAFGLMGAFAYVFHRAVTVAESRLAQEQRKVVELLHNILPVPIASRLKDRRDTIAEGCEASVLFADIVGFTSYSSTATPQELVVLLDGVFSRFDDLVASHGLEKIKTIGDAYMVAAGVPVHRPDHAAALADLALDMRDLLAVDPLMTDRGLRMRIGLSSGPVVAGVIGKRKFAYDLWGDSVNTAARMESHGLPGEIQISEQTRELLGSRYDLVERGMIDVKGKGPMRTWLLRGRLEHASVPGS
jgi:adenylate cyclase